MKRLLILLCIFSVSYTQVADCTGFETALENSCKDLGSGTDICIYSERKCIPSYTECSQYTETNFDDKVCTLISPTNILYKCVVKMDSDNKKTCEPELKECKDHTDNDDCISLKAENNKRCVLYKGQCTEHFETCSDITNKDTCEANIPKETSTKCKWDSNACGPSDRLCEDLIEYNDKYTADETQVLKTCSQLSAEENKVCVFFEGKECKQYYENCGKGNGNKDICNTIKPLNIDITGFDPLNKCLYSDSTCSKELRECKDFISGEDDEETCRQLKASNTNKMCYYNSTTNKCSEIYKTCTSYNLVETDPNERASSVCDDITPRDVATETIEDPHSICYLDEDDEKKCKSRTRKCEEIKTMEVCNSHTLDDPKKRCLFTTKCIEVYKTCDLYEQNVSTNKKKEDCEIIEPDYEDGKIYKCIFNEENSECTKKELKCEDYTGQNENYCKSLIANLESGHKCALIGGKCTEQYNVCDDYDGTNKTICESIILYNDPYHKCLLLHDKECEPQEKLCSEYSGDSEVECSKYKASVDTKACVIENHKCVEKSIFNYCSDYRGTNKEECESIKPYNTEGSGVDPSSKCVYTNEGCIKKSKECKDATSELECPTIIPTDDKKQCVYIGNSCTEQYKTCQLYNDNEQTIDKTICESILNNEVGYPSNKYKCEYTAPASSTAKATCTRKDRSCSDFMPELVRGQCSSISLIDTTKKCVYDISNNSCSPNFKTCSELSTLLSATDEKCKNGIVSSENKACVAKSDKSGCEEKEKEKEPEPSQGSAPGPAPEPGSATTVPENKPDPTKSVEEPTDDNSFAGKKDLSKLIFIIIWLLL